PAPLSLHSFPTRRSSDLWVVVLPNGRPGGDADPELPRELPAMVKVGHGVQNARQLPGIVLPVRFRPARNVRQIHVRPAVHRLAGDRKSTRLNSSHVSISY